MTNAPCAPPAAGRGSAACFSLIETLIAAVIILIVFIGVLPLFSQAMINNTRGNDASRMTNATVDGLEELLSLPFNNQIGNVPVGATMLTATDFFLRDANIWVTDTTPYPTDAVQYTRISRVEQFSKDDLDGDDTLDSPLPGETATNQVQMKRYRMTIQDARWNPGTGSSRAYEVVFVKSY